MSECSNFSQSKPHLTLMTDEQKFFFDLKGWIVIPAVLSSAETESMKSEVYNGAENSYSGNLQKLLDHPAIVSVLTEILSEDPFGFKLYAAFLVIKTPNLVLWLPQPRLELFHDMHIHLDQILLHLFQHSLLSEL